MVDLQLSLLWREREGGGGGRGRDKGEGEGEIRKRGRERGRERVREGEEEGGREGGERERGYILSLYTIGKGATLIFWTEGGTSTFYGNRTSYTSLCTYIP